MARQTRSDDWGFPRWRSYGDKGRSAARVRLCDREGCTEIGDRPALKGETVVARCRCDRMTRQVAFVSGIAHTGDPDKPVARATGTFMLNP